MKNVTGYDLQKLYTGSLGTLAIIVEISLKLRAKFARTATAIARFGDSESAGKTIAALRKSPLQPVACEWVGPENEVWYGQGGKGFGWGTVHHAAGTMRMPFRPRLDVPFDQASTTIDYADWGISIPSVPFVASVGDQVALQFDFGATAAG